MCTMHEVHYTFFIISRSVLLRMRNVSEIKREEIKTQVSCSTNCLLENRTVYETM
jgi:hypothetical protein